MSDGQQLRARIAALVSIASEGVVPETVALAWEGSLADQGLTSLSYLRLLDAIETEFGIYVDLEDETSDLRSVGGLSDYVGMQGVPHAGA